VTSERLSHVGKDRSKKIPYFSGSCQKKCASYFAWKRHACLKGTTKKMYRKKEIDKEGMSNKEGHIYIKRKKIKTYRKKERKKE